jgi:hypothetical protein
MFSETHFNRWVFLIPPTHIKANVFGYLNYTIETSYNKPMKIDTADKYFSLYIRTRDNWTCKRCITKYTPPTRALHCSHFQGRRKEGTRFEPLNADALCHGCHQYFTSHPAEHTFWQVQLKGQETVDRLILQSNTYKKKDRKLEAIIWKQAHKDQLHSLS